MKITLEERNEMTMKDGGTRKRMSRKNKNVNSTAETVNTNRKQEVRGEHVQV